MGARKHAAWALGLVCAIALPASARAGAWLPPAASLSDNTNDASEVHVAMDSGGDSVSAWVQNGVVQYAYRTSGASNSFSGATNMPGASTGASHVRVAMDPNGDAAAVWQTSGGRIEAAYMPSNSGGTFGSAQKLQDDGVNKPTAPDIAIDGNGDLTAVWQHFTGAHSQIEALYGPSGAFPAFPATLDLISSNTTDSGAPVVGMDSAGDAQAVWLQVDGSAHTQVQEAPRPAGNASSWGAQVQVSTATVNAADAQVAMSGPGSTVVVWDDANNSVLAAYSPSAGSAFGGPQTLDAAATNPAFPAIANDDAGNAEAVWQHSDGTNVRIEAVAATGGDFSGGTPTVISQASEDASAPQIAMDSAGDAVAVWADSTTPRVHGASHASSQFFAASTQSDLSATSGTPDAPSVAIDASGDGVAGWQRSNGTKIVAEAAGYDAGPQIPTLHVPAAPYAGHAVTLYAQGSDVWSPISATTWTFGDGGTGNGPAVVHTYSAGSHTATATVTAADGLTQNSGGSLTVAPRPGPVFGGLYQLDAPNDCLSGQPGSCGTTLAFATGFGYQPVVSPNGRNVYYIALVGSIGEYARDQSTGALTSIGCVTGNLVPGCTAVNNAGLNGPAAAAFSPDGKNLYVATQGDQAVVTFSRDPSTGLLTFTGCIGEGGGSSCPTQTGKGIATPYGIVVSADGKNVYVSSAQDQAVSEFDRNTTTGALTQKASPNDCITALASGCGTTNAPGLQATIGIAASPDGANVYVLAGGTGGTGQGDIAEFSRSPSTGVLSQLGGGNACLGAPGAPAGCATTAGALQGIEDMALSPDGRFAYANSFITSSVVTLARATNGALTQADCITSQAPGSPAGCSAYNVGGIAGPLGVAISPDADTVYVSGASANGEAAFQRNSTTGRLTALPHPFDCITLDPSACGQSGASGLGGARRVAVSPDGKNVYVAGQNFGALTVLARTAASDLGVAEAGAPASATTGSRFTYAYTISEHGPSPANDAVLTVNPAGNVSRGTLTTSQGSCSGTTCHLGRIASGSSVTVHLPVTAASAGPATSGATVTPSSEVLDPDGANNTVHTTTSLTAAKKVVPPPVLHKTGNVSPSKGTIKVKVPGSKRFVLLTTLRQIPFGSTIDATHGTVKVVVARRGGGTMTGYFSEGQFLITQARDGRVTLKLVGGNFKGCPVIRKRRHAPLAVTAKSARRRPRRKLFSNAHGSFTTQGGSASGSVRGTEWLTADYCDGTGITVYRDVVRVTNLRTHKSVNVHAGHTVFIKKA